MMVQNSGWGLGCNYNGTLLFASNIDAVAVASRLGHAKADTTLRIYAHALRRRDEDSAAVMQSFQDKAAD